jgi:plastocyanin
MKKILMILSLICILFLVVACTSEVKEEPTTKTIDNTETKVVLTGTNQVVIEGSQFMPTDLEVSAGTTVEWINKDSVKHTVTFENGDLDEVLPIGGTATFTFEEAGEYRYFCQLHPGMQGSIIVD